MGNRDSILTDEQITRLWTLVTRAYRRLYHRYRPLDETEVLDWSIDTLDGREAFEHAAKVITGEIKDNPYA